MAGPPGYESPEQPADLVEGFAGSVIDGLAQQPVAEMVGHLDDEGMPAAHDQRHQGELRRRSLLLLRIEQPGRIDVPFEVVHRHQWQAHAPGQRLGHGDAYQQRAGQARAFGDGDRVHLRPVIDAGSGAGLVEHRDHPAQMRPRRHLGHDAAGGRVQLHLAGDDAGHDTSTLVDHGHGGLIAGRLDRQDPSPAHASPTAASSSSSSGTSAGSSGRASMA